MIVFQKKEQRISVENIHVFLSCKRRKTNSNGIQS